MLTKEKQRILEDKMRRVDIFDTTLRDGEQAIAEGEGSLSKVDKFTIASLLADARFDVIEAGFPKSSGGDFEAVKYISQNIGTAEIAALCRATDKDDDIKRAYDAVKYSANPRVHTFIAVSPIHMERKLRMTPQQVYESTIKAVKLVKRLLCEKGTVEFSGEDSFRAERDFLVKIYSAAIQSGADVINVPDTVGYAQPEEVFAMFRYLMQKTKGAERVKWSFHGHNDLGNATANSLAAIRAGAHQIEGCINGIGERAGNTALEEIIANMKTRPDYYDEYTQINTRKIGYISRQVSRLTGMVVQPNKAVVGGNAFAHSAGIHQDGVIKHKATYEIMKPEDWGWTGESMQITKHSGRKAYRKILEDMGYKVSDEEVNAVYAVGNPLADKVKKLTPLDLAVILEDEVRKVPEIIRLSYARATGGTIPRRTASVKIVKNGLSIRKVASGDGPIDALYNAINSALGIEVELGTYRIRTIGEGKEVQGEITTTIRDNGNRFGGRGVSTDIIEASAKAYIRAVNKMLYQREKGK